MCNFNNIETDVTISQSLNLKCHSYCSYVGKIPTKTLLVRSLLFFLQIFFFERMLSHDEKMLKKHDLEIIIVADKRAS